MCVRKYLARDQDVRTERSEVSVSRPRAKYFPFRPDLTQSINILSYDHYFVFVFVCLFFFLVERRRAHDSTCFVSSRAVRVSSRGVHIFSALSLRRVPLSNGTFFFLMVFQGNSARGRTGHMMKSHI